jgi:hypothetical protein
MMIIRAETTTITSIERGSVTPAVGDLSHVIERLKLVTTNLLCDAISMAIGSDWLLRRPKHVAPR